MSIRRRGSNVTGGLALALMLAVVATGSAEAKTTRFSSGPMAFAIPDQGAFGGTVAETPAIRIKKRGKIRDLNVALRITHPDTTQLEITMLDNNIQGGILTEHEPKDGGNTPSADFGSGAADCSGAFTVFDDEAALALTGGTNPYVGSFVPTFGGLASPTLDGFRGFSLEGKYKLDLDDAAAGGAGVLHCWELIIRYKPEKRRKKK